MKLIIKRYSLFNFAKTAVEIGKLLPAEERDASQWEMKKFSDEEALDLISSSERDLR